MRQVLSMFVLFIKIIPLPLHNFSSFLLVSLILSSKSWSLLWIVLDNAIFMLSLVSYSLIEEITFCIYIVSDIICSTMNNYQIRFFTNSGSDITKSSVVAPGWLPTFTESLRETSCPFTYLIIESLIIKTSFFTIELFADCRLIKLPSSLSLCTVV